MTAAQIAEHKAVDALPRFLVIIAGIAVLSIGLMIWTSYAGLPEIWRTDLLLLNFFADSLLVNHFILKKIRRAPGTAGAAR